jgi:C4-dicarboxylate-specific signal transduction histidine kinase
LNHVKPERLEPEIILKRLMEIARVSALEELASGIAHELNQPLGAIATFAQAGERMLDRPEPLVGRAVEVLRQINQSALCAGEGIHRIRRLFDPGESARVRCRMPDLVQEMEPVLDMLALRQHGRLHWNATPDLPELLVDRLRIQHVLFALVQNACDAGGAKSAEPVVKIDVEGDRYAVQTSIVDSGAGVPDDHRSHLFKPFFTTKSGGTGLGLASCRAIIEAHEGTIGFDNLPAGGSRFWFRLPAASNQSEL